MEQNTVDLSETNGEGLFITVCFFLAFSWVAVGLRTYTRAYRIHAFCCDDWIMLIAQATFTTYSGFLYAGLEMGMGRHNAAIEDIAREVAALKWQALAISMYIFLMMLIKLSIGFFLLRITIQMPAYTRVIKIGLAVICVFSVVVFLWNIFQCIPVEKQWDYRLPYGQCVRPDEIVAVAYVVSAMTIVTDFFYALLPIPMVWNVKMTMQAKMTVILLLGMGIFASVATIIRIRLLPTMANLDDVLYAGTDPMIWTIVEAGLAIIAVSLATIRPLLRALRIQGFELSDDCENNGHTAMDNLESRRNQQRRFHQFYGINGLTLTDDTLAATNLYFSQDEAKPHHVRIESTAGEPPLPQSAAWRQREDTEVGLHVGYHEIAPMAG